MLRVLCSGYFFVLLNILIILFMPNEIFCISDILNMNFKIKRIKEKNMEHLTRREEVDLYETMRRSFPKILIKDLAEHERICPVCNGLGMRIEDNIYGIKGDTSEVGRKYLFPYKHQALSFCQSCYNGVQQLCPYCGQPYKNQAYMHCDCEGQKKADEEERLKKWNEKVTKAVSIDEKDVNTMLYCEEFDEYYDTVDDFFEDYAANYEDEEVYNKPERLWVTSVEKISIDAYSIIENACEGLHEDAMENIDEKDIAELEEFLDNWCKKQTGTTTYYPCYKQYVVIDWNRY